MANKVLQFLFGKDAKIFNAKGKVQHDLGKSKWTEWKDRFAADPNYDFSKHHGRTAKKGDATKSKP